MENDSEKEKSLVFGKSKFKQTFYFASIANLNVHSNFLAIDFFSLIYSVHQIFIAIAKLKISLYVYKCVIFFFALVFHFFLLKKSTRCNDINPHFQQVLHFIKY